MKLPELNADGYLDPGIYLASLEEVLERFGTGSSARERLGNLLRLIVESARKYPTQSPLPPFEKGGCSGEVLCPTHRNRRIWMTQSSLIHGIGQ
ncbi:hypothetical protein HYR99_28665 [Candidatus Poribacteria bacterium]|nr:hypothetical protein [Candidatus Poribacteria bacterium]